jgi:hypothetical protein
MAGTRNETGAERATTPGRLTDPAGSGVPDGLAGGLADGLAVAVADGPAVRVGVGTADGGDDT